MSTNGMITSPDQLTTGRFLWRIFAQLNRVPTKFLVNGPIIVDYVGKYINVTVITHCGGDTYQSIMYLRDYGIGANYNVNRIFETEAQALAYYDSFRVTHP